MNAFTGQTFQMNQIINIKEVIQFTSISRAKIYEMINVESRIGWVAWEVHLWIEGKLANRA